jgi:hypothetical protein
MTIQKKMKATPHRLYKINCCIKTVLVLDLPFELSLKNFIFIFYQSLSRLMFYSYIIAMISVPNITSERHPYPRTAVVDKALRERNSFLFILHYRTYKNSTKPQSDSCYVFFVVLAFIRSTCPVCSLSRYIKCYSI